MTVADSSWVISKMSVFIRFNVSSQISVTGFCTDFATMLNGGGDVHFRVYPGRLYHIALYQLDGTLLGYLRIDVPAVVPVGVVRPGGDGGGDNRGGNDGDGSNGGFVSVPGASTVTLSGSARTDGVSAVRARLASLGDFLASIPGSASNPIVVDDGSTSSPSRSASASVGCSCSSDMGSSDAQGDIDMTCL